MEASNAAIHGRPSPAGLAVATFPPIGPHSPDLGRPDGSSELCEGPMRPLLQSGPRDTRADTAVTDLLELLDMAKPDDRPRTVIGKIDPQPS